MKKYKIRRMSGIVAVLLFLLAIAAGCGEVITPTPGAGSPAPRVNLRLEPVLAGMEFDAPTNFVQFPAGFVLVSEQDGRVLGFNETALQQEHIFYTDFLDIRDRVNDRGWEEGLLGMTLSPHNKGHLFVHYSAANPRRSVVSRFSGSLSADPDSELVILEVEQPYANHNGGQIAFGPDGHLYVALGDGGAAGDPQRNGQDTSTLLGTILRIDVSGATAQQPYVIPPDNPFADGGGRPEIWAYGLRNPWRFSFDRETGELWTGDVGQNRWEEIDIIERGGNYGWNAMEGAHCFRPASDCESEDFIPPVWEYSLDGDACSVIGGYVYQGAAIPELVGAYVYGDFCTGEIFGLRRDGGSAVNRLLLDTGLRIASFGEDNGGELYVLSQGEGIFRLVADE